MKNYIGFVNDHSGSMSKHAHAAVRDYNVTISAFRDAANQQMLDTIVSVVGVGIGKAETGRYVGHGDGYGTTRQVTISNPHVLKPINEWSTHGGTPLWDGIGDMISLFKSLPDYNNPDVSFLVMVTTDGQEEHSGKWSTLALRDEIESLQRTGRWTFVFRIPRGGADISRTLGVAPDNVQTWDTTNAAGLTASTAATTAAVNTYYAARSAGSKSTNVFYTTTQAVDTSKLADISKKVSLYTVGDNQDGIWVKDFILTKRMEYKIGAAFYQLVKTEARVQPTKLILIRDRKTGAVYAGNEARSMIGLDTVNNARLHPNHGNGQYDIFIQSESINRHLPKGTGVIYWEEKGRAMTQADLEKFAPKVPAAPAVVQLPSAPATGRPTPSPIAPRNVQGGVSGTYTNPAPVVRFASREEARKAARAQGKSVKDLGKGVLQRWMIV